MVVEEFDVVNMETRNDAIACITAAMVLGPVHVTIEPEATRTVTQNSALHLYLTMLADALNAAGLDMAEVLKKDAEIPWTPLTVKERLWRPIQQAMLEKASTTRLSRKQVSEVYDVLNRHTSAKLGVSILWPDKYSQSLEAR